MTRKLCNRTVSGGSCIRQADHSESEPCTVGRDEYLVGSVEVLVAGFRTAWKATGTEQALSERIRQSIYYLPTPFLTETKRYAQLLVDLIDDEMRHRPDMTDSG